MRGRWWAMLAISAGGIWLLLSGCQALSDRLTKWEMLDSASLEDPVKAVGDAIVFAPVQDLPALSRQQLAQASLQDLTAYYTPLFIQQRINTQAQPYPYPPEYDEIGEAQLRRAANGQLKAFVAGPPQVYTAERTIGRHKQIQLTFTAWYPAHPRMKSVDLEAADIDSCVVRVTLDTDHVPLFYETLDASGCFHKVFVERWLEEAALKHWGKAEEGKKYAVERNVTDAIDWEVAGVIDEPRDQPRRSVVVVQAGDHKVLGMGSTARLRMPHKVETRCYRVRAYADLEAVRVQGSAEKESFFPVKTGRLVPGAERAGDQFLLSFIKVRSAGQPRANEQIMIHFDQTTWNNRDVYARFLRLPPGAL